MILQRSCSDNQMFFSNPDFPSNSPQRTVNMGRRVFESGRGEGIERQSMAFRDGLSFHSWS